ncbi:uncharacterized protein LOC123266029 [Cotesia glomerata]|uniref:uncharacterized protein LOC123266029 n=1 Tax=Cotesia glomerata TaxID=32391 RepID=UPI001D01EB9C|nr:uncharacterized protein LOC123266029 [Cotesia glomerata]
MLKLEIKITIWQIHQFLQESERLQDQLRDLLPNTLWTQTQCKLRNYYDWNFTKVKNNNIRKFNNLLSQSIDNNTSVGGTKIFNFMDVILSDPVRRILTLDGNFGLVPPPNKSPIVNVIKDFEGCLCKVKIDDFNNDELNEFRNNLRARGVNIITNYLKNQHRRRSTRVKDPNINSKDVKLTRDFLRENDDLIVTRSDKGNATVVMRKQEYLDEMNTMVTDESTYIKTRVDPTSRLQTSANALIKNLKIKTLLMRLKVNK